MKENNYYIGVDIGTTCTKAVLFDHFAKVLNTSYQHYELLTPTSSTAEQDPDEIFNAVINVIKDCMIKSRLKPQDIKFVSFSCAMHSLLCIDGDGNPLTKSITWADTRSSDWAIKIMNDMNGLDIYHRTGTIINAASPLSKMMWLKNDFPEIFKKTSKFISIKEYVFYKLFGKFIVDHSIANAMGLFNIHTLNWDIKLLKLLEIIPNQLSTLVPTTYKIQGLKTNYALSMNLSDQTTFIIGASDGVLSNLGMNVINKGTLAITIGTSGAIRATVDKPFTDPFARTFCYNLTDKHWVIGGAISNGGLVFNWVKNVFKDNEDDDTSNNNHDPYDFLSELASIVEAGSNGLIFHPFLSGERAPVKSLNSKGSFFGLGLQHKKGHLVRASLEGVAYSLFNTFQAIKSVIGPINKIHATGGFARSKLWCQILSDVFNQEIDIFESFESSCLGAIILGQYAIGEIKDFNVVSNMTGTTTSFKPNHQNVIRYSDIFKIYLDLSKFYEDEYSKLAKYQKKWSN